MRNEKEQEMTSPASRQSAVQGEGFVGDDLDSQTLGNNARESRLPTPLVPTSPRPRPCHLGQQSTQGAGPQTQQRVPCVRTGRGLWPLGHHAWQGERSEGGEKRGGGLSPQSPPQALSSRHDCLTADEAPSLPGSHSLLAVLGENPVTCAAQRRLPAQCRVWHPFPAVFSPALG